MKSRQGSRSQPVRLYVCATLAVLIAAVFNLAKEDIFSLPDIASPLRAEPKINWRTRDEAFAESRRTHKPILYFELNRRNSNTIRLEFETLNDPEVAACVYRDFLPVKVKYAGPGASKAEVVEWKKVARQIRNADSECDDRRLVTGEFRPVVSVVPANSLEMDIESIASTGSLVEKGSQIFNGTRGEEITERETFPYLFSYEDTKDFSQFLSLARIWHTLPPTRGDIHWCNVANLDRQTKKPRVIFMLEKRGCVSDLSRRRLFGDSAIVKRLNLECDCYLIEADNMNAESLESMKRWQKRYSVSSVPAIVVLKNNIAPSKLELHSEILQTTNENRRLLVNVGALKKSWKSHPDTVMFDNCEECE